MTPPVPPTGASAGPGATARRTAALGLLRRHGVFAAVLLAGGVLRLFAVLGFRPAFWFNDSYEYLGVALRPEAYPIRPDGYSWFLRLLQPLHSFAAVVVVQHLLGIAVAVALYLLLVRSGLPGWLAAVAMLPQLLSVRQVQLEHLVMSDTLFTALLVGGVVALGWRPARPSWWCAAGAGLALSAATLVRSVGLPLLALAGVYLLVRRAGWRAVLAFGLVAAVPLAGYAAWYHGQHGRYELTNSDGVFLYSRTMTFADCARIAPPPDLAQLCDQTPLARRPAPSNYIWHPSPLDRLAGPLPPGATPQDRFVPARNDPARRFALLAVRRQPLGYARAVLRDVARSFSWAPANYPGPQVTGAYRFSTRPLIQPRAAVFVPGGDALHDTTAYERGPARTRVIQPYAGPVISYQRVSWLPGPVLGALLVVGLVGVLAFPRRDRRRWQILLLWSMAAGLLVLPPMTAQFDQRYVLPAVPFACAAAALAAHVLLAGRKLAAANPEPVTVPAAGPGGEPAGDLDGDLDGEAAPEPGTGRASGPGGEPGAEPGQEPADEPARRVDIQSTPGRSGAG
ncbi:MAG: hypothetical protein V7637_955 [Mycobacteriales bacterium]